MSAQLSLEDALTQRDETLQRVAGSADVVDRAVVEQAIRAVAARGVPFSSNDVRPLLPALRSNNVVGPVFGALVRAGEIRRIGYVPSTSAATKGHPVALYEARENPCPECDEGEVIPDGPMEWDTGHWPVRCSHRCGFTS